MEIITFILVVILLVRWFLDRATILGLEQRIADLTSRIWKLENPRPAVQQPEAQPVPVLPPPPPPVIESIEPAPPPALTAPEPGRSLAEVLGITQTEEWEAFIGGSLLNKIGALILVVGIALFLGYSFGHLTAAGRASIAIAISTLLLAAGVLIERRGRYQMFSRGLIGAGWAALYATSYAIYALPEARIIGDPFLGSLVMLLVAGAMVTHSLYYRSQAVTAVAFFAAFAALAATPNSPFAVISLIPLAAAVLYLASRFEWHWLPLFGLAATYLTCISRGSSNASLSATQSLFLLYWLLFEGFDLIRTQRRVIAHGLHLVSPLNTLGFFGLSYLSWSHHDPSRLWIAAAFGAALFFADMLIRFHLRPPSTFTEDEQIVDRIKAGSFESSLVICAALGALSIVGRVPGIWSGAVLAVEAEVLYLAGLQLDSPFVRALGYLCFIVSLGNVFFNSLSLQKSLILGHRTWDWTPAALFHAFLFSVNRTLRKPNAIFSSAAVALVAVVIAAEVREPWIGMAWAIFGTLLFELAIWKAEQDFRQQGHVLLFLGTAATLITNLGLPHAPVTPLAITLAIAYQAALRPHRPLQIGATAATALLGALLIYRLVPTLEHGLAWMALGILFLLHERVAGLREFRVAGTGVAALAILSTLLHNIEPPTLALSLTIVALLFAAQFLMTESAAHPEATLFSVAAAMLLAIILYGRVSGGLLTVAWGCEGLALLGAGFPLGQRTLRLEGLVLLFTCILKLFLYDLRNLETLYRILSFVALGLILLGVSWIYTRFQDQIKKML
jgi:hypothetical protein